MSQTKAQLISDLVQALNFTGTASAPANGVFLSAANTLALATNSAQRLTIDSSGNVGIGTTTPSINLQIVGSNEEDLFHLSTGNAGGNTFAGVRGDNEAGIRIRGGGSERGGEIELGGGTRNSDPAVIKFSTNTSNSFQERMRIDSSGNVGLGVTSISNARFRIKGANNSTSTFNDGLMVTSNNETVYKKYSWAGIEVKGGLTFNEANSGSVVETMRIDTSGRVGIGTTSPALPLHIAASVPGIRLTDSDGNTPYSNISAGGGDLVFEADQGNEEANTLMLFRVDDSERMRIDSSGRLLLGTTTASAFTDRLLTVASSGGAGIEMRAGTSSISQLSFSDGSGNDTSGYRGFISYQHASDLMQIGVAASARINITSAGNVGIGTASPAKALEVVSNTVAQIQCGMANNSNRSSLMHNGSDLFLDTTAGDLVFRGASNAERMRLDSSGSVIIGDDASDKANGNFNDLVVGKADSTTETHGITIVCGKRCD